MKPSKRITELARKLAEREGELLAQTPESYWLQAMLAYLDEEAPPRFADQCAIPGVSPGARNEKL